MVDNMLTNLIVYRNLLNDRVLNTYNDLYSDYLNYHNLSNKNDFSDKYYHLCSFLMLNGFDSMNDYISQKIFHDENIFSIMCEKNKTVDEKVKRAVLHDFAIIKKFFEMPFKSMASNAGDINNFLNFNSNETLSEIFKSRKTEEIYEFIKDEYSKKGCGIFRNNFAFSINDMGDIIPVENFDPVKMENIYGYESQKSKIINNTKRFINNQYALNALLVGDSGTGKSTAVKALIPMFKMEKLRLIEFEKQNLNHIPKVVENIKNRGMYFIIFIDDLSFEQNENSYKYLKSVVEGSIYEQPNNILFYVTSNRKHLIKESITDRNNEVHMRDAINEQTSLSDRFGLTILYSEPTQTEYYGIVLGLAGKYNINHDDEEQFLLEAKKFALQNGGRSGRTAVQFIKSL